MNKVNFGCGPFATVPGWTNYDASPTLRLQRLPIIGFFAKDIIGPRFSDLAYYGDVVRGLPVPSSSVDFVYCSHVLEHLSLEDLRLALIEVSRILRPGAIFRGILPDLESEVHYYVADVLPDACSTFMRRTFLGQERRPRGLISRLRGLIGNSQHLWMWDFKGLAAELENAGFVHIRRAVFNDSAYSEFLAAEDGDRWENCLGFECRMPEK